MMSIVDVVENAVYDLTDKFEEIIKDITYYVQFFRRLE